MFNIYSVTNSISDERKPSAVQIYKIEVWGGSFSFTLFVSFVGAWTIDIQSWLAWSIQMDHVFRFHAVDIAFGIDDTLLNPMKLYTIENSDCVQSSFSLSLSISAYSVAEQWTECKTVWTRVEWTMLNDSIQNQFRLCMSSGFLMIVLHLLFRLLFDNFFLLILHFVMVAVVIVVGFVVLRDCLSQMNAQYEGIFNWLNLEKNTNFHLYSNTELNV